jgi:hypothetical protein
VIRLHVGLVKQISCLSVPCRPGTPHIGLSPRQGRRTVTCHITSDHASLLGRAPTLPRVLRLWILPPCSGGLRRCHVSHNSRSCRPAREGSGGAMCPRALDPASMIREGSGAATCPAALDPASLLRRALALPRVLWL